MSDSNKAVVSTGNIEDSPKIHRLAISGFSNPNVVFHDRDTGKPVLTISSTGIKVGEGYTPDEAAKKFVEISNLHWFELIKRDRIKWLADLYKEGAVDINMTGPLWLEVSQHIVPKDEEL